MSIYYIIRTLPHKQQRYNTVGDYITDVFHDTTVITVSECGSPKYEFLVAIHEFIEHFLCKTRGIPEAVIDEFDIEYEKARQPADEDEPGNHPLAPYHKEHIFATHIEKLLAKELGVDWNDYEETLDSLYLPPAVKSPGADK